MCEDLMECFSETMGNNVFRSIFHAVSHEVIMCIAETVKWNLAVEVMRGVEPIIERMNPQSLPESIVGPRITEMICHVEAEMLAHLCPPSRNWKDEDPGYNKVVKESSPNIVEMNSCKDCEPVKDLGGV